MRTLFQLGLTIAAGIAAAVAGLYVVRLIVPHHVLVENNDVAGNYLQTLGTIYGVLLAFVVFVVWSQNNEASKLVEREADGLRDVVRLARALGGPVRLRVLHAVEAYAKEVIDNEWPAMQHRQASPNASRRLGELWQVIELIEPASAREEALYAEAVRRFNDLGDARTDRLQNSGMRLPLTLRLFLLAGGVCTVGSLYLFGLELFWPLAVMTAIMAGAVSHILFLIWDLDTPFSGDWQVKSEPIDKVLKKVERELQEMAAGA